MSGERWERRPRILRLAGVMAPLIVAFQTAPVEGEPRPAVERVQRVSAAVFADVPEGHPFQVFVERLYELGVTAGCATDPLRYCPDDPVTRAQMSVFLLRARYGPSYTPPPASGAVFVDVPVSNPFAPWVERLAAEGITAGCGVDPPRFCPDDPVTRAQMSVFLLRARYGSGYDAPPTAMATFADVPATDPFFRWVEQLARERITAGCEVDPPRFCPDQPVTRGQMAVFLGVAFQLLSDSCRWSQLARINAPVFASSPVPFAQTAVAWFGFLDPDSNFADLRVGVNGSELYVYVALFDRHLWYDETPTPDTLTHWDAVTLLLDTNGAGVEHASAWRFVAQLYGEPSATRRASWRGSPAGWQPASVPFAAVPGWRGNALNDNTETDRGWAMGFTIPFTSLDLPSTPGPGTLWRMAVIVHDRDTLAGPPLPDRAWPVSASADSALCWGLLHFGLPLWSSSRVPHGTVSIRRPTQDSPLVPDADVGGSSANQCPGDEYHIWNQWANSNWGSQPDFNVQNQSDIADWPCFARYYVTFPLDTVPAGKHIVDATLRLHQFGNGGGAAATPTWMQVLVAASDWQENTITWNNAPPAVENVGGAWVAPIDVFPGWPGVVREWDVSLAVERAYRRGEPLRLVLYSADSDYHSGKYFVSSDTGDWNSEGRPALVVRWASP
ncbi:MAG TPA: DNRLRE domain-containing protein [Thermoanaerobaculaceae bacterium]|nr:DNRLRE domain-containing protein [Thermoanaerobaculaceae bacterium]